MAKQVEISRQANLLTEAFMLLSAWANSEDLAAMQAEYADNYKAEAEHYNAVFNLLTSMYETVKQNLAEKKDRIDYYFKERHADMSSFGALAVLMDFHQYDIQLRPYAACCRNLDESDKIKRFALIINCEEAANTPPEQLKTLADLMAFIEASPYDKADKWEAIKIWHNLETHYQEVYSILNETIHLLQTHFARSIADLEKSFYDYWTAYLQTTDLVAAIADKLNVSWPQSANGTIVMPFLFQPLRLIISIYEAEDKTKDVIRMGVLLDQRLTVKGSRLVKDDVVNIGKILGDRSKIDILEFVSKKPAYGKEIANGLALSTATISYHVNALIKMGFLQESVNANRIYYSVNRARISARLDDIKQYFA